jgi:hypothetical protein
MTDLAGRLGRSSSLLLLVGLRVGKGSRRRRSVVIKLDVDVQLVPELVNGRSVRADEVSDVSSVDNEGGDLCMMYQLAVNVSVVFIVKGDREGTNVAVLDLMVLGLLDDSKDLLLNSLSLRRRTSDGDGIRSLVGRVSLLVSNVDNNELLLADQANHRT